MGRTNVLIALIREGFKRDASAVATSHFDDEFFTESVWYGWLTSLWPNIRPHSQPYLKEVQDKEDTLSILEIPDNGALADYVKASEMVKVYQACLAYKQTHPQEAVSMNFGFHDVNAFRYLERVTQGIEKIRALAAKDGVKIVPVTSETMKYTPAELRQPIPLEK